MSGKALTTAAVILGMYVAVMFLIQRKTLDWAQELGMTEDDIRAALNLGQASTRVTTTPASPKAGTGSPGVVTVAQQEQELQDAYDAAPRAFGGGAGTITERIRDAFAALNPGYDAQLAEFARIEAEQKAAIAARGY